MKAQQDSPHGIGGWLVLLIAGMTVIGPLLGIARTYAEIINVERQYPDLAQAAEWSNFKACEWTGVFLFSAISLYGGYGLATKRTASAVYNAKMVLWFNGPISVLTLGLIVPAVTFSNSVIGGSDVAKTVASIIGALIAAGIWVTYLDRSKRVRHTYGLPLLDSSPSFPSEDAWYEKALEEIENGETVKALWARALAEANGDDGKAKATYIRLQVAQLRAAHETAQKEKTMAATKATLDRAKNNYGFRVIMFFGGLLLLLLFFSAFLGSITQSSLSSSPSSNTKSLPPRNYEDSTLMKCRLPGRTPMMLPPHCRQQGGTPEPL